VLVQGTGGVSIFALQFSKMMGARVLVTSSSPRSSSAPGHWAPPTASTTRSPRSGIAGAETHRSVGVDHVVDVGGALTLERSFRAVRRGGRVSVIGVLAGATEKVNPMPILMKGLTVQGIFVGNPGDVSST